MHTQCHSSLSGDPDIRQPQSRPLVCSIRLRCFVLYKAFFHRRTRVLDTFSSPALCQYPSGTYLSPPWILQDQALEFLSCGNQGNGVGGKHMCRSHPDTDLGYSLTGSHPDLGGKKCCQLSQNRHVQFLKLSGHGPCSF